MVLLKGAVSPFFGLYKEFFCVVIILLGINKLKFNYVFLFSF
ncbi:hypothetical protein GPSY_0313 [Paraglaciecola psychrophila 170]|nr:hypothetical protein GPSY_0313 [Paraglaciecola psychrophila 170]